MVSHSLFGATALQSLEIASYIWEGESHDRWWLRQHQRGKLIRVR
jgi:hypothetical protein